MCRTAHRDALKRGAPGATDMRRFQLAGRPAWCAGAYRLAVIVNLPCPPFHGARHVLRVLPDTGARSRATERQPARAVNDGTPLTVPPGAIGRFVLVGLAFAVGAALLALVARERGKTPGLTIAQQYLLDSGGYLRVRPGSLHKSGHARSYTPAFYKLQQLLRDILGLQRRLCVRGGVKTVDLLTLSKKVGTMDGLRLSSFV